MKPIIISGAMDIEIQTLIEKTSAVLDLKVGSYEFYKTFIEGTAVIISKTNVGMINAASATMLAINHYNPWIIINQGTLGGYAKLSTGDIVVVESSKNITSFEKAKADEIDHTKWVHTDFCEFDGDLKKETKSLSNLIDIYKNIPYKKGKVYVGSVGSGDVWNREKEFIKYLNKTLGILGEDMETHAVATVAKNFNIPFIGVRIVSNNELLDQEYNRNMAIECQEFVYKGISQVLGYARKHLI